MTQSVSQWEHTPVASCGHCQQSFSLKELLEDETLVPAGMLFSDEGGNRNELHFEHRHPGCGQTFKVPAMLFASEVEESLVPEVPIGTEACKRLCFDIGDNHECEHQCLYAPFRRFLISLKAVKAAKAGRK